jgi:hypothetical protein
MLEMTDDAVGKVGDVFFPSYQSGFGTRHTYFAFPVVDLEHTKLDKHNGKGDKNPAEHYPLTEADD